MDDMTEFSDRAYEMNLDNALYTDKTEDTLPVKKNKIYKPCRITIKASRYGVSALHLDKYISKYAMMKILDMEENEYYNFLKENSFKNLIKDYLKTKEIFVLLDIYIRRIKEPFDRTRIKNFYFVNKLS